MGIDLALCTSFLQELEILALQSLLPATQDGAAAPRLSLRKKWVQHDIHLLSLFFVRQSIGWSLFHLGERRRAQLATPHIPAPPRTAVGIFRTFLRTFPAL